MEITLNAPAKSVFLQMKKFPGCFLRKHKKSLQNKREYFRLMDEKYNPIKNFPYYKVKQLCQLDLLVNNNGQYSLKDGLELPDKRKKKKELQPA